MPGPATVPVGAGVVKDRRRGNATRIPAPLPWPQGTHFAPTAAFHTTAQQPDNADCKFPIVNCEFHIDDCEFHNVNCEFHNDDCELHIDDCAFHIDDCEFPIDDMIFPIDDMFFPVDDMIFHIVDCDFPNGDVIFHIAAVLADFGSSRREPPCAGAVLDLGRLRRRPHGTARPLPLLPPGPDALGITLR